MRFLEKMIIFRKLYARFEEGVNHNAIIVYGNTPWFHSEKYDERKHLLYIDLWIFILRFEWTTKDEHRKDK